MLICLLNKNFNLIYLKLFLKLYYLKPTFCEVGPPYHLFIIFHAFLFFFFPFVHAKFLRAKIRIMFIIKIKN